MKVLAEGDSASQASRNRKAPLKMDQSGDQSGHAGLNKSYGGGQGAEVNPLTVG